MKRRVEELEKEVDDYRRREQDQQSVQGDSSGRNGSGSENTNGDENSNGSGNTNRTGSADVSQNGSPHAFGQPNENGNPNRMRNENPGADQGARRNTSTGNNNNGECTSISGIEDGNNGKSASGYSMYMDTCTDDARAPKLTRLESNSSLGGTPSTATSTTRNPTLMSPPDSMSQPECRGQTTHPNAQYPPQMSHNMGHIYPNYPTYNTQPLAQQYSLSPDWSWQNTAYRDSMSQQTMAGNSNIFKGNDAILTVDAGYPTLGANGLYRSDQEGTGSEPSYHHISPDVTYLVQPGSLDQNHLPIPDADIDPRPISVDHSTMSPSTEASSPQSLASAISSAPLGTPNIDDLLAKALAFASSKDQLLRTRPIEDRFEFMQLCVASGGFTSFDAMVRQYYTADFSHDSLVTREQRSSRHSQLPVLLSKLRKSVKSWTEWESHGYQYEIIKSAESIIRAESANNASVTNRALYTDALAELERLHSRVPGDGGGGADQESLSRAFRPLSRVLQDTVSPPLMTTSKNAKLTGF